MADPGNASSSLHSLRRVIALTRAGMVAERLLRAFWPLMTLVMALLGAVMLGVLDHLPGRVAAGAGAMLLFAALIHGLRRLRWPARAEALSRLDATLPGRPIAALMDAQAIGGGDSGSEALWQAHRRRMAARAATARAVRPDLRLSRQDPFALRFMALLVLMLGFALGTPGRINDAGFLNAGGSNAVAGGPAWEGWIEPPRYTGRPALYLADQKGRELVLPEGSRILLRFYGDPGALSLAESVSGGAETGEATAPEITVAQDGELAIKGPEGRGWQVRMIPDHAPQVRIDGPPRDGAGGAMALVFTARDDYGVTGGEARIELDLDGVERRHGLATDPEPQAPVILPLPLPISGGRAEFTETLIEDLSSHLFAHLPVRITLRVRDAAGNSGESAPLSTRLPGRRFFDPMAAALAEQRRDLLWSRENAPRVAQILRAVSHRPDDDLFPSPASYLRLRAVLHRLETAMGGGLDDSGRDEITAALWDLAVMIEDGELGDVLERLNRARERLSEAMKNGASDREIADLMQDLRDATRDYLRQLAEQDSDDDEQISDEDSLRMEEGDLQAMMDRIQELMEQGRMAEAEQALQDLQRLMENMRVSRAPGDGAGGQGAMEGLAETLRDQQRLSDRAFRDFQDRFDPRGERGETGSGREGENDARGGLADEQRDLRERLGGQRNDMPAQRRGEKGEDGGEGESTGDALGRAEQAMREAEEALRNEDFGRAIDRQSEAMEALREGMRELDENRNARSGEQDPQEGGEAGGERRANRDPLGRDIGGRGAANSDRPMLGRENLYDRARELLDEIRRRSGEGERPRAERDYLDRLLDQF